MHVPADRSGVPSRQRGTRSSFATWAGMTKLSGVRRRGVCSLAGDPAMSSPDANATKGLSSWGSAAMTPILDRAAYQLGYRRGHPALVGNWDRPPSQIGISQVQMGRRERVGKRDTGTGATLLVQACVEVPAVVRPRHTASARLAPAASCRRVNYELECILQSVFWYIQ
jgi:hypothetical protein